MTERLEEFLNQQGVYTEIVERWHSGIQLRVRAYVTDTLPEQELVTTVRAVVWKDSELLVIRDASGYVHITPGGRREPQESLEATLRREVAEETGWSIRNIGLLGLLHFHHVTPKPEGYRYPYPDFLQLVYMADADGYQAASRKQGGYEVEAEFRKLGEAQRLGLPATQMLFLTAGLQRRMISRM